MNRKLLGGVVGLLVSLAAGPLPAQAPSTRPAGGSRLFEDLGFDDPPPATRPADPARPNGNAPRPPADRSGVAPAPAPNGLPPNGNDRPGLATGQSGFAADRSVSFVLDVSASDQSVTSLKQSVGRVLNSLQPGYRVRVLAASDGKVVASGDDFGQIGTTASDPARAAAVRVLQDFTRSPQSELRKSLPQAMAPRPKLLYLLIDGKSDLAAATEQLRTLNADKQSRVNLIYFEGDAATPVAALEALARQNNGKYVVVTRQEIAAAGSRSTTRTVVDSPDARSVDLLPLFDLDRDVVNGRWKVAGGELICIEGSPGTLRLPYKPPAEFDLVAEFTATDEAPLAGAGLMGFHTNRTFGFYVGTAKNTVAAFGSIEGRVAAENQTAFHGSDMIVLGKRHQVAIKLRTDSVTGWLDGKQVSELPLSISDIVTDRPWKIGGRTFGLGTNRRAIFHSVRVVEHTGRGAPVARFKPQPLRPLPLHNLAKSVSLSTLKPIAIETDWDQFRVGQNPDKHPVRLNGQPCDDYLFAHGHSSLVFEIPPGAIAFRATGVKPAGGFNPKNGNWRYFVYVDGDEAFVSPPINDSKGLIDMQVVLPLRARQIELRIDKLGSNEADHSIWAEPKFLMGR